MLRDRLKRKYRQSKSKLNWYKKFKCWIKVMGLQWKAIGNHWKLKSYFNPIGRKCETFSLISFMKITKSRTPSDFVIWILKIAFISIADINESSLWMMNVMHRHLWNGHFVLNIRSNCFLSSFFISRRCSTWNKLFYYS